MCKKIIGGGQDHYDHWDQFVKDWIEDSSFGPQYLLNSNTSEDYSRLYVPEPWWGRNANSDEPLYSVCINLNPGKGIKSLQTRKNTCVTSIRYYSDLFGILPGTNKWHNNKRALPIRKALHGLSDISLRPLSNDSEAINNHISIELIPWHTEHATDQFGFWKYVSENLDDVYNHSLLFAADEASRIIGLLKDIVLLRFSGANAISLFNSLKSKGLIHDYHMEESLDLKLGNPNVHAWVFSIDSRECSSKTRFVSIWRSKGWGLNNFPGKEYLKQIISLLQKPKDS